MFSDSIKSKKKQFLPKNLRDYNDTIHLMILMFSAKPNGGFLYKKKILIDSLGITNTSISSFNRSIPLIVMSSCTLFGIYKSSYNLFCIS